MRKAAALALLAALAACKLNVPPREKPKGFDVYKDGKVVLWIQDQPGTFETSAGPPPPGIPTYTHPGVTATARDPAREDHLRALLEGTSTFAQYRAALEKEGYRVVPVGTKP